MWRSHIFWRLFGTYALLLLGAIGMSGAVIMNRIETFHRQNLEQQLHSKAFLIRELIKAQDGKTWTEVEANLRKLRSDGLPRVTLVNPQGVVLLDTDGAASGMDNHGDRPEIV